MAIIKFCTCPHIYQDGTYGKQMRVHNLSGDKTKARCTVCGREISVSQDELRKVGLI